MEAELPSTVRQVSGFVEALRSLWQGSRLQPWFAVQVWTDSQAAYARCSQMRGNELVFEDARDLYLLAWATEVSLS